MTSAAEGLSSADGTSAGSLDMSPFQAVFAGTNLRPDSCSKETGSVDLGVWATSLLRDGSQRGMPRRLMDQLIHGFTELCVPFLDKFLHRRRCE